VVFHIVISYNIYLSGGSGQTMLCNTAATVRGLTVAVVVGKGGGGRWHWVIGVVALCRNVTRGEFLVRRVFVNTLD